MLMAPIYGQDPAQNLEFCLKSGFDNRASEATKPFYTYLASFAGVLTTLLGGVNSVKMTFATIVGTATTVFSQFSQRIQTQEPPLASVLLMKGKTIRKRRRNRADRWSIKFL